jgi:hypothetical protein
METLHRNEVIGRRRRPHHEGEEVGNKWVRLARSEEAQAERFKSRFCNNLPGAKASWPPSKWVRLVTLRGHSLRDIRIILPACIFDTRDGTNPEADD